MLPDHPPETSNNPLSHLMGIVPNEARILGYKSSLGLNSTSSNNQRFHPNLTVDVSREIGVQDSEALTPPVKETLGELPSRNCPPQ